VIQIGNKRVQFAAYAKDNKKHYTRL